MKEIIDYRIITSKDPFSVERDVLQKIQNGWSINGNLKSCNYDGATIFVQSIVKTKPCNLTNVSHSQDDVNGEFKAVASNRKTKYGYFSTSVIILSAIFAIVQLLAFM